MAWSSLVKWNIDDNTFVKLLDPETGDATRLMPCRPLLCGSKSAPGSNGVRLQARLLSMGARAAFYGDGVKGRSHINVLKVHPGKLENPAVELKINWASDKYAYNALPDLNKWMDGRAPDWLVVLQLQEGGELLLLTGEGKLPAAVGGLGSNRGEGGDIGLDELMNAGMQHVVLPEAEVPKAPRGSSATLKAVAEQLNRAGAAAVSPIREGIRRSQRLREEREEQQADADADADAAAQGGEMPQVPVRRAPRHVRLMDRVADVLVALDIKYMELINTFVGCLIYGLFFACGLLIAMACYPAVQENFGLVFLVTAAVMCTSLVLQLILRRA